MDTTHVAIYHKSGRRLETPADFHAINREVCEDTRCDSCGHWGMQYVIHGDFKADGVCPRCGWREEW